MQTTREAIKIAKSSLKEVQVFLTAADILGSAFGRRSGVECRDNHVTLMISNRDFDALRGDRVEGCDERCGCG